MSTSTAVTPLLRDVVQISTRADPACGRTGAREVAYRSAAIETLRQGYDGFFVVGLAGRSNPVVIGRTPVTTRGTFNVSGSHVSGTTTSFGGAPIVASAREEDVTIQMVSASEPAYRDAIDARSVLGKDWEAIVERGSAPASVSSLLSAADERASSSLTSASRVADPSPSS